MNLNSLFFLKVFGCLFISLIFLVTQVKAEEDKPNSEFIYTTYFNPMPEIIPNSHLRNMQLLEWHKENVQRTKLLRFQDNFKFGFHIRPRYEYLGNPDFNRKTNDSKEYVTQQTQIYFIGYLLPYAYFKITIQDSRLWGGTSGFEGSEGSLGLATRLNARPMNLEQIPILNTTDIREAFIGIPSLIPNTEIILGRQAFGYGDGRIIAVRNFNQIGNSFDGIRTKTHIHKLRMDFLLLNLTENNAPSGFLPSGKSQDSPDNAYFWGNYNSIRWDFLITDIYGFVLQKNFLNLANERIRVDLVKTYGLRISNRTKPPLSILQKGGWDYSIESAWQLGTTGERIQYQNMVYKFFPQEFIPTKRITYDARFFSFQGGYTIHQFRVGYNHTFASGDPNREDGVIATWNPLFGVRKAAGEFPYFAGTGLASVYSFRNVKTHSLHLLWNSQKYGRWIFVATDTYKAKAQDGWYGAFTGSLKANESTENRANNPMLSNNLGKRLILEYSIIYQIMLSEFVSFWTGYSHVYAGDSIRNLKTNWIQYDPIQGPLFDPVSSYFFIQIQFAI